MPDDPGESRIIERARPPLGAGLPGWSIGDDAALIDAEQAVTTDAMVEGVHFDDKLSPADVGWKLVAVNVSDIAAMGFVPRWCTLTLALPRPVDDAWAGDFFAGLHDALRQWEVRLIGGDTTRSPGPIVASMTLGGSGRLPLKRSSARPGDWLFCTGTLGDAAAGFHGVEGCLESLRRPRPPTAFAAALAACGVHACMDITDGLHRNLWRLCQASGVGATVRADELPAHDAVATHPHRLALQTAFGEDYQLLFTAPRECQQAIAQAARNTGTRVSTIGTIDAGLDVRLDTGDWPAPLFQHFGDA